MLEIDEQSARRLGTRVWSVYQEVCTLIPTTNRRTGESREQRLIEMSKADTVHGERCRRLLARWREPATKLWLMVLEARWDETYARPAFYKFTGESPCRPNGRRLLEDSAWEIALSEAQEAAREVTMTWDPDRAPLRACVAKRIYQRVRIAVRKHRHPCGHVSVSRSKAKREALDQDPELLPIILPIDRVIEDRPGRPLELAHIPHVEVEPERLPKNVARAGTAYRAQFKRNGKFWTGSRRPTVREAVEDRDRMYALRDLGRDPSTVQRPTRGPKCETRGVTLHRSGKFVARFTKRRGAETERVHVGLYATEREAARAIQRAKELALNDSPPWSVS